MKERGYNVNVEVKTTITNAFLYFNESVTNNQVVLVKYPMGWFIKYATIDGVEYELDRDISSYFSEKELQFVKAETRRFVKNEKKSQYLKDVTNAIIEQGSKYINLMFDGNFHISL